MSALVPVGIGCLVVLSALSRREKRRGMSSDRKAAFARMMNECTDGKALREVAAEFGREGFKAEEHMLKVKADRVELPKEKKDERRAIFRESMQLKDPEAVEGMAKSFEEEYCMGAARALYDYARGLRGAPKIDDSYITELPKEEPAKVRVESKESHVSPPEKAEEPEAEPPKARAKRASA